MSAADQIQVRCLSSSSFADRPISILAGGATMRIEAIVQRWRTPEGPGFLVRIEDGQLYRLQYISRMDDWRIEVCA